MKSFTIAAVNLKRFVRDRSNVFFVFIFPMLLILVFAGRVCCPLIYKIRCESRKAGQRSHWPKMGF